MCQSSWALQSCPVTPALTVLHTSAGSTSGETSAEKNFWEGGGVARGREEQQGSRSNVQRAEPLLLHQEGSRDLGSPTMGLCCCCQSRWDMELCWCGAARTDRTPGCTVGNQPDNCSGNVNTAGWGFAIQNLVLPRQAPAFSFALLVQQDPF